MGKNRELGCAGARRVMQSQREDMAQGKSRQGQPIQQVIHMAFMDIPEAMTETASAWVGSQAKRRRAETDGFQVQI